MGKPPWKIETGLDGVLDRWRSAGVVRDCLALSECLEASTGRFAELPSDLAPGLREAIAALGITKLFSHQATAIASARAGKHTVLATPTASGKSLAFHVPVLDAIRHDPSACGIYLYPTKALARDQEASLLDLLRKSGLEAPAIVYDGDTPGDARRVARERANLLLTNPDMLHASILPHHTGFARVFQRLKYIVVDELHTYRGVFGSHVAHVLSRLMRVAAFYGSKPTVIAATATIGNPRAHAANLFGVPETEIEVVSESGAPRGERNLFLYNPPVVNAELGIRKSYLKSAVSLTRDLMRARVPTIVFGQSRNAVEIMLKYLRVELEGEIDPQAIMAYRGGYLPDTRRKIERGLRDGDILGVVATNALELGIDIGDLDAVVCAGYPGSIAGTWQRFGRAGRRGRTSAAILVTSSNAIDQYLAGNPDHLLGAGVEEARIDPKNTEILVQHLKCAAFELPFESGEAFTRLDGAETREALGFLSNHGVVHETEGRFHWATDAYPANHVSLRSVGWDNTVIIDVESGQTLAELDWRATPTMLHEQAIYQHDAEQFQVERLDHENHKAFVRKVEPDYFTTAMTNQKLAVIQIAHEAPLLRGRRGNGEISVVEKVVGFKKIKFFTHENAGYGDVRLPDVQMHTAAFWWIVPSHVCFELDLDRASAIDGLRGVLRALETVSTVALMCDPRDIAQALLDGPSEGGTLPWFESGKGAAGFDPTLFLYDNVPGGIGLADRIYEEAPALVARAGDLIARCSCERGCPLCVGAEASSRAPLGRKQIALRLLRALDDETARAAG